MVKANSVLHDSRQFGSRIVAASNRPWPWSCIDGGVVEVWRSGNADALAGVLALRSYFVQCDRGSIRMILVFYRPGDRLEDIRLPVRPHR